MKKNILFLFFIIGLFLSCSQPGTGGSSGGGSKGITSEVSIYILADSKYNNYNFEVTINTDGKLSVVTSKEKIVTRKLTYKELSVIVKCYDNDDNLVAEGSSDLYKTKQDLIIVELEDVASEKPFAGPVMTPGAGRYNYLDFKGVTLSSGESTDVIYYTLDGSKPDNTKSVYSSPVEFTETKTVKAVIYRDGKYSAVSTGLYELTSEKVVSPVQFSVSSGIYQLSDFPGVVLTSATDEAQIRYSINGALPDSSSDLYESVLMFDKAGEYVIRAAAFKDGFEKSSVSSVNITITAEALVKAPVISPSGGMYNKNSFPEIVITSSENDVKIYYSIDKETVDKTDNLYSSPIVIDKSAVLRAAAYKDGKYSAVVTAHYELTEKNVVSPVQFSLPEDSYFLADFPGVVLTSATDDAQIKYSINDASGKVGLDYTAPIVFNAEGEYTVRAAAFKDGFEDSSVTSVVYKITKEVLKAPIVTPAGGTYKAGEFSGVSVFAVDNVVFRYTVNGGEPDSSSDVYTDKILFDKAGDYTVRVKGFKDKYLPSETVTAVYKIEGDAVVVTAPKITPNSGSYYADQFTNVDISTTFNGAVTYYTVNGNEPDNKSAEYKGAFTLDTSKENHTVKAVSFFDGVYSDVVTAVYNITERYDGAIIYYKAASAPKIWVWSEEGKGLSNPGITDKMKNDAGTLYTWANQPVMTPVSGQSGWFEFRIPSSVIPSTCTNFAIKFNEGAEILRNSASTGWYDPSSSKWTDNCPDKPGVNAVPGSSLFSKQASVRLSVTGSSNVTVSKYSIDGKDPKTSGISFNPAGETVVFGGDAAADSVITLRLYALAGSEEVTGTYTYTKSEQVVIDTLGAIYSTSSTTFRIWNPDNAAVTLTIDGVTHNCVKVDDYNGYTGVYGVTVPGDHKLKEYQFKFNGIPVRDPYGRMVKYEAGLTKTYMEEGASVTTDVGSNTNIVMDVSSILPEGGWAARPALAKREDTIIYEAHIGDFTSDVDSGVSAEKRGKYLGMVQTGTKYSTYTTGIDHLVEMGVTHVQILPFYDSATRLNQSTGEIYNWGYDPVNFNVPEERYSQKPDDYEWRIKELKTMISEFHKNGIRVIMDVVYNHTMWTEMFENISKSYYYDYENKINKGNLSGCGNAVDSGNAMVSRFIRDSLEYWATEFNIDGFRFDLVGIFHTAEVNKWGEYLNGKYPDRNFVIFGEPWNGYATDPNEGQKVRMSSVKNMASGRIGVFNGKFRESIKGSSDDGRTGYMFNNTDSPFGSSAWNIAVGMKGSGVGLGSDSEGYWTRYFAADPEQTVNYITAHDNYCLYDKILVAGQSGAYAKRLVNFGHGIVLVSQGIPFIHSGDEFLRTKKIGTHASRAHNSYMWGQEMNKIYWKLKATNYDVYKYHKDLIALRKANEGLRFATNAEIQSYVTTEVSGNIVYMQTDNNKNGTKDLFIVVNPGNNVNVNLPSGSWTKIFDAGGAVNKTDTTAEGTAVTIFKRN